MDRRADIVKCLRQLVRKITELPKGEFLYCGSRYEAFIDWIDPGQLSGDGTIASRAVFRQELDTFLNTDGPEYSSSIVFDSSRNVVASRVLHEHVSFKEEDGDNVNVDQQVHLKVFQPWNDV